MRLYKKGYGQIAMLEFHDDDGSWTISVESEKKGTLFKISSDNTELHEHDLKELGGESSKVCGVTIKCEVCLKGFMDCTCEVFDGKTNLQKKDLETHKKYMEKAKS